MTPSELIAWRKACGFPSWAAAGRAIGKHRATMHRYVAGVTPIPEAVRLACKQIMVATLASGDFTR